MFRSEEMSLVQLFIQPEAAYTFVARVGEAGIAQFSDLNADVNAFQRKYVGEVRRCEEMERKVRIIIAEIKKEGLTIPEAQTNPKAPNAREATELEAQLERTENEIVELTTNSVNLKSSYQEVLEYKHVLERTHHVFQEEESHNDARRGSRAFSITEEPTVGTKARTLGFIAGVVRREKMAGFERMLWRVSRGNVFLRQSEIDEAFEDPHTGNPVFKTVFVAFFQGEELKSRFLKVCNGFHATIYQCPDTPKERVELVQGMNTRLEDLRMVLNQTSDHRQSVLVAVARQIDAWSIQVRKMKAVYHTMNTFNMDVTQKCLIGECWVPKRDVSALNQALVEGSIDVGTTLTSVMHPVKTNKVPPTFNRTNKFTRGFQNLIDAYGVASYGEVNPALYTIITFPFLFAVMFGDMGHGLILTLFGAYMVIRENKIIAQKSKNEIWNLFFGGRYIILLMGLFSIYTGAVYNDIFSKSVNVFGSSWISNLPDSDLMHNESLILIPSHSFSGYAYPFGLDPAWQLANDNKINFQNSFKMKLSIIIGIIHMLFGVTMSTANNIHFKTKIYILLEFVPQFLFLLLIFFYLVILIFLKWILYSGIQGTDFPHGPGCAPSVLIIFIHMMLFTKADQPLKHCETSLMYDNQEKVQTILMVVALLCIPVMLMGKPIYLLVFKNKKPSEKAKVGDNIEMQNGEAAMASNSDDEEEEHEAAGEIIIHQMIHTIEYVLSTISHTASYLRLWALSLAHGQLSEVLWTMVLHKGLSQKGVVVGVIFLFIVFTFWALLTLAILVAMEGLSAFLHTLRLHWVEFMSKFYTGLGYLFQPFSFKQILAQDED